MISPADILRGKILIVDDQQVNLLMLAHILRGAGYSDVASTTDPRAVLELHRAHRYDLILLDIEMPDMDGFQVMEALKEIERDGYLPVLVVTAEPAHKLRALRGGARRAEGQDEKGGEAGIRGAHEKRGRYRRV